MPDGPGMLRPDESASVKDDDFVIESFSDKEAFAPPPDDTTMRPDAAEVVKASPVEVPEKDEEREESPPPALVAGDEGAQDHDHLSHSRLGKPATPAEPQKPKVKNKAPLAQRTVQLKHEVDTLTHQKHRTRTELEADEKRLADVRRELADLDAKRGQPPVTAGAASADETPMPTVPKYRDYATDEEYESALGKYHVDLVGWQKDQYTRMEQRISQGVDARFRGDKDDVAAHVAEERLIATLDKVRNGKADWQEKAAALKDLRSSWYDPSTHGDALTPFLSDLARSRLAMGFEDGAELLYWLGEDSDRAQVLADLFPNRPVRDALVYAPSLLMLFEHFATDEGQAEFEALKRMHPVRVNQAIGALSVRLAGASSGSPAVSQAITKAHPSARPPGGTPGAHGATSSGPGKKQDFLTWYEAENAKELADRKRLAGIAG